MVHTKKKNKKMQKLVLYLNFFCNFFTMSLLVLIYVHGLVEFSRSPALCMYKIKVLFAYSEITKMHQAFFAFVVVNFCVTEC